MSFLKMLSRRFMAFMSGRNGIDQLSIAILVCSLVLQIISSLLGSSVLILVSVALYGWALFRVFSRKNPQREIENQKFMAWFTPKFTKLRQFVLRQKLRKFAEGTAYVVQILEKVEMVGINVENDADGREEAQKAVGVFAGFCDKKIASANSDIAADGFKHAADGDGRIQRSLHCNVGEHGGSGGFSVCSRNSHTGLVIAHHLSEKLGTGQHGDAGRLRCRKFGIVGMNCRCIHDQVVAWPDVAFGLSDHDLRAGFLQCLRQL